MARTVTPIFLGDDSAVPTDRPFTTAMAMEYGVSRYRLDQWVARGLLRHPIRGVYHAAQLADGLELRIAILKLVVPADCVVTDRTAGWLWGANMILAPNDHEQVPRVHVFSPPGYRLRNGLVDSGERLLASQDVVELDGLRVTTALRTACDLGRLLHRDQAFAAMDSLAGLGRFAVPELVIEGRRFKGYRGIVQFRALAPYVDPGAQSPPESILRLRWLDIGLPRPQCQVPVPSAYGGTWWLDVGLPEMRFAAEYDGEAYHTEADRAHDVHRRDWLRSHEGWTIVVARKRNLFGRDQNIEQLLREGAREALK
jgi:hypothetical protein